VLVTPSVNTYPYKAYIETLLSSGPGAHNSHKTCEGWYQDGPGNFSDVDAQNTTNQGLIARTQLAATSAPFELIGRPHVDVFQQDRYLLPGVDMSLKLTRSPSAFHLMSDANDYKLVILDACIKIRRVKLSPGFELETIKKLNDGHKAKYPLRRGIVHSFTVSNGMQSFNKENVLSGQLPRRLIIGMVRNNAYNGLRNRNPYEFEHFNITSLVVSDGNQNFPSQPYKLNFTTNTYMHAYHDLVTSLGIANSDKAVGFDRKQYKNGHVLFGFDLTADMSEGAHVDPIRYGNIRIEGNFSAALAQAVNVIVYAEYDNVMQIDRSRNVMCDF
jgi:hypothetical protein